MKSHRIETAIENGLFASRWIMAPMYMGLILALAALMFSFFMQLWGYIGNILTLSQNDVILGALTLIDLTLAGNLMLIVVFSGYENFVSKINTSDHEDQPDWKGSVDFSALKLKLIASIVAISGIHLLKVFMEIGKVPEVQVMWMVIIHMVFVISGVLLALMDYVAVKAKTFKKR